MIVHVFGTVRINTIYINQNIKLSIVRYAVSTPSPTPAAEEALFEYVFTLTGLGVHVVIPYQNDKWFWPATTVASTTVTLGTWWDADQTF